MVWTLLFWSDFTLYCLLSQIYLVVPMGWGVSFENATGKGKQQVRRRGGGRVTTRPTLYGTDPTTKNCPQSNDNNTSTLVGGKAHQTEFLALVCITPPPYTYLTPFAYGVTSSWTALSPHFTGPGVPYPLISSSKSFSSTKLLPMSLLPASMTCPLPELLVHTPVRHLALSSLGCSYVCVLSPTLRFWRAGHLHHSLFLSLFPSSP